MRKFKLEIVVVSLFFLLVLLTGCGTNFDLASPTSSISTVGATLASTSTQIQSVTTSPSTLLSTPTPETTSQSTIAPATSQPTTVPPVSQPTTVPPTFTAIVAPTPTIYSNNLRPVQNIVSPPALPSIFQSPTPTLSAADTSSLSIPAGTAPDSEEQKFVQLLNVYRTSNGVGPLALNQHLLQSSHWMAQDMATKNYVAHVDSQGRNISTRIHAFGYPSARVGENIAGGFEFAQDNLNVWESDQIHKDNLLGKYYTVVGVGRYYAPNSLNHWYWVLDLGG